MESGPIVFAAALLTLGSRSDAGTLEDLSYQAGSDLGRAIYCRAPSAGSFARLAEAHIRRAAPNNRQWRAAVTLYLDATWVRAVYGPITESCEEFLERYEDTLKRPRLSPTNPDLVDTLKAANGIPRKAGTNPSFQPGPASK